MGVNREEARRLARKFYGQLSKDQGRDIVLDPESEQELDIGWVFSANSPEYIKSRDVMRTLVGIPSLIIDRKGHLHVAGTGRPIQAYVEEIRASADL